MTNLMVIRSAASAGLAALLLLATGCESRSGGPAVAVAQDTTIVYQHSMRSPEALADGRWSLGDIETVLVHRLGANGWQRSEQLTRTQGGGDVPAQRRGRWSVTLYEPDGDGYLMHGLSYDRRLVWTDPASDPFGMPPGAARAGEDTLLGLRCTVWRYADDEMEVDGCYTDEGVMLRQIVRMRPSIVRFEASEVRVEPIPLELLAVPAGWHRDPGHTRPPPPAPGSAFAATPDDLLHECAGQAACLSEQARFRAAWPRAQAGNVDALAHVARCLTQNCEGAVRIYPPIGCVFAVVIERRTETKRPETCWRDTSVPEQGFIIDSAREFEQRSSG